MLQPSYYLPGSPLGSHQFTAVFWSSSVSITGHGTPNGFSQVPNTEQESPPFTLLVTQAAHFKQRWLFTVMGLKRSLSTLQKKITQAYFLMIRWLTRFIAYFINSRHKPTDDFHLLWLEPHFFFSFSESSINFIFVSCFTFTSWKTHFPWWSSQLEFKEVLLNITSCTFLLGSTQPLVHFAEACLISLSSQSRKWWLRGFCKWEEMCLIELHKKKLGLYPIHKPSLAETDISFVWYCVSNTIPSALIHISSSCLHKRLTDQSRRTTWIVRLKYTRFKSKNF